MQSRPLKCRKQWVTFYRIRKLSNLVSLLARRHLKIHPQSVQIPCRPSISHRIHLSVNQHQLGNYLLTPEWWTAPSTSITMAQILHQSAIWFRNPPQRMYRRTNELRRANHRNHLISNLQKTSFLCRYGTVRFPGKCGLIGSWSLFCRSCFAVQYRLSPVNIDYLNTTE